jgi:hypothetical protein
VFLPPTILRSPQARSAYNTVHRSSRLKTSDNVASFTLIAGLPLNRISQRRSPPQVRDVYKLDFGSIARVMILDRDTEPGTRSRPGARQEILPLKFSTP